MTIDDVTGDDRAAKPVFEYVGRVYVRPVSRGIVLDDHPRELPFEDVLDAGDYRAEIRVFAAGEAAG